MKRISLPSPTRLTAFVASLVVFGTGAVRAQFIYNQDFKGTSAAGWVFGSGAGSPYTPTLTAAAGIDAVGDGWLRMTDLQANEATYARLTTPIPSANNNITVALDLAMWNKGTGGAADGMTISLRDASVPFAPGAYGGSLGYANRSDGGGVAGMAGGYFSLGIDNYGNFSNPTEGRNGGTGFVPNSIATRGPGSGQTGYAYLGGTGDLSTAPYNMGNLDFPNATTRPDQTGVDYRQLVFNLDSSSILTVSLKLGTSGTLTQIYTADLSGFARPENLELVYTGSTGGGQQINELRSLVVTTTAAPVGNVYYSNYGNDNKWGTGANWGDANVPNLGLVPGPTANLIFSNNPFSSPAFQLTTAQNVDLQQNRTAASIQFDAPFNYNLQGYQLTLDNGTNATAITVTSAQPGGAHTIESNLVLNSNLNINTNTNTALVLQGNINAGVNTFTLNNLGTTTFAGQITGSGAMVQNSTGTVVISGNSSSTYTGNIDVQKGTLQLGGSNVLNAGTNLSLSSPNGTGTFNLAGNNQTLGALTFASGGLVTTGSGTLTLGGNVASNASATDAQILGNLNLGASDRTFTVAQGAADPDMTIGAAIGSTGGGLIKNGSGSMLLSGNNSYTGATSILTGALIAAHDNALGTANVGTTTNVANGATLALRGGITLSSLETITLNGVGDIGFAGALDNLSGNNAVAGPVTLLSNSTIGAAAGTQLTLGGTIGQSGGARSLTASGAGTIVLAGSNGYTGATTVNAGTTLVAASNNAMGTNAAGTTVTSGGTLGFAGGITYSTAEAVNVAGTGVVGGRGAIDNISGDNSFAGPITMTGDTTVGAADGTTLTLSGVVGQSGTRAVTIAGTGTVVFGGTSSNTYGGATVVNSGATLVAAKNGAMGTTAAGTTISSGATLAFQGNVIYATTEAVTVAGAGAAGRNGAIENLSGANSFSGAITLAGDTTVSAAAGSQLTLAGVMSGAQALEKAGGGTVILTAADTFSGATTVAGGTLALGGTNGALTATAGLTVSNATLFLDNTSANNGNRLATVTPLTLNDGTFTFVGNTAAGSSETTGSLTLGSGSNTLNIATGTASLTAALTLGDIIRSGSSTLTINAFSDAAMATRATLGQGGTGSPSVFITTDNFNASSGLSISGASTGSPIALPGWITTVTSSGTTEFVEYSGDAGTGNGVRPVTAYTGNSGINVNDPTKIVQLTAASPQSAWLLDVPGPTSAPVNNGPGANRSGSVNGKVTVDSGLKLADVATVDLNTDSSYTLVLKNGGLIKTGASTTNFQGAGALTSGNGYLAITVDDANGVLNLSAPIVDNATNRGTAGAVSLTKAGAGLLTLSGANGYTGSNFLTGGTVRISSEANLGGATNDVTFSGGTLNVTGSFTTNAAKLFTVSSAQSGTFDINNGIILTLANTSEVLTTADANGTVNKLGAGTLVVPNANVGFDGTMNIAAGSVQVQNAQALGDATNRGRVILSGGTLDLRNNAATAFANNVTVTADSAINVDRVSSGTNLTHSVGTLSIGANTLAVTGAGNGFDLSIGATTLTGAATINTNTVGSDVTLGAVSGVGSLTKGGGATLTLSAANTYTGATTINGGSLRIGAGTALLPSATNLTIASGASFDQNGFTQTVASLAGAGNVTLGAGSLTVGSANSNTSFSGAINGTGGVTKNGTGTLTLSGANSFTGSLAVNQGAIAYGASNVLGDAIAVSVAAPAAFNLANNSDIIGSIAGAGTIQLGSGTLTTGGNNASTGVTGVISGGGGRLVKAGTGTMSLSAGNTYSGSTTVNAGVLAISNSSALGSGDGSATTGTTVASGATLQVSGAINVANEAIVLSGAGASGAGALQNVSGNNTLGGPVGLNAAASVIVNAGNLSLMNTVSNNGNTLTVGGTGNTVAGGAIVGSGGLTKTGAGALILNNPANAYTGATAVNSGSIQIGANNAGPVNSAVTIAPGATLDVNNKVAAIASLAGGAGSAVILGNGTLSAGSNNSSTTYAGVISGVGGGFTKNGSGNLTLSGANTFTGATNINGGMLTAGANNVLTNQTAVTVASGATFTLNSTTQAVGSIAGGGAINLGGGQLVAGASNASTAYSGVMSGTGSFTKDGSGNLTLLGANTYTGATTIGNGTLTLGATNALSASTSLTINNGASLSLGSGVTDQIAGLTTNLSSTINLGANSVLTTNQATGTTLVGNFTGTGTLAFTGGGNLTLGADLSLAGGTLAFGGNTIGNAPTSTLFLGGNDLTLGTLRITGDTILDFGNSASSVLTTTSFVITDPNIQITIKNWVEWQDFFYAANWSGATLGTRGQGSETQVAFDNHAPSQTNWQTWDHQITPTPEPATYGLLMSGALGGLAGFRRWRKRRAPSS